jgi:hypothetical protein
MVLTQTQMRAVSLFVFPGKCRRSSTTATIRQVVRLPPFHVSRGFRLPAKARPAHASRMFVVTEEDAAAIRTAYEQGGELSAAIELRRLFPGITDNTKARLHARTIAGWQPLPQKTPRS